MSRMPRMASFVTCSLANALMMPRGRSLRILLESYLHASNFNFCRIYRSIVKCRMKGLHFTGWEAYFVIFSKLTLYKTFIRSKENMFWVTSTPIYSFFGYFQPFRFLHVLVLPVYCLARWMLRVFLPPSLCYSRRTHFLSLPLPFSVSHVPVEIWQFARVQSHSTPSIHLLPLSSLWKISKNSRPFFYLLFFCIIS